MAYGNPMEGSLKRKRRRREDKPAISARIFLDGSLKGEAGVLSADLVEDLYPRSSNEGGWLYAALTPWTPSPSPAECSWCILSFRGQSKEEKQLPPSTIRFPAGAPTTQSFVHLVQGLSPTRTLRQNAPVEVRISDVVPLTLDAVYVSVDSEAITKLEEVQKRFGGGFASANGYHAKRSGKKGQQPEALLEDLNVGEDARRQLVNEALGRLQVVHTGDILPLALIHPVTHAPAPPAKVLACEPVAQGILAAETKVVITSASSDRRQNNFGNRALMSPRLDEESEEEDTSHETFYSATEDTPAKPLKPIVVSKSATDFSNTDDTKGSETEDSTLSDDSDDMISLVQPGISDQPSGLSSALTSATPRAFVGNRTGGVSTPGSVYSHMSTSTVRGGQATRSKMFRAQGLLDRVPEALLHPRPASEEDEEARVYVDSNALARLGCFSGDWVKIEAAENSGLPQLSAFGALGGAESQAWRPVKVYGLPEIMSKRPQRYQVNPPRSGRRDSIPSLTTTSGATSTLYAPPILLANLNQPENLSLAPLAVGKRTAMKRPISGRPVSAAPKQPPTASEVTLRKIVSPLSSERALSNVLFANLKEHFERRQRIVKAGDLIAIPIDESLGRSLYEGAAEQDDSTSSALLAQWQPHSDHKNEAGKVNVSWFTIESVNVPREDVDTAEEAAAWAGAASIDPTRMTMRQSGDDRRKLPPSSRSTWPYYYGVKTVQPKPAAVSHAVSAMPEAPQGYISALHRRIRELITVSTSPRAVHLGLPPLALLLTSTQRSIGKTHLARTVCADLGIHFFEIDAYDIASEGGQGVDTQAQGLLEARCERALDCGAEFTAICVRHIENLSSDRVAGSLKEVLKRARVLVATTTDVDKISDPVRGLFTHELAMSAPDEGEREGILRDVASQSGIPLALDVDFAAVAVKTAALVAGDLVDVVERAVVARTERLTSLATAAPEQVGFTVTMKDIQLSGGAAATSLIAADFDAAVDLARKNFADAIGAPKIPNVQWSDVGGLTHVKDAVVESIQLPLSRPELFAKGLKKRSGILFYGPPGTGKTLLAKAIATEFSLNFFSVKGPELLNMYIGESEANVRRVFQRARDARPCVVFFDELDSVAPKRGNQGDSGGVMDRIVSQLLAELDGMSDGEESGGGVFVIGATNRPDLLDPALLRPGRFDKMLYLGISDTHEKQATILQALTRKFTLDPSLSLARVAASLPFTFTGADLYALCSDAMLKAVTRSARRVDERLAAINAERGARGQTRASVAYYFDHHATDADTAVAVTEEDFVLARRELVPSVSVEELRHYERVRATFEGAGKKEEEEEEEEGGRDGVGRAGRGGVAQVVDGGDEVPAVNGVARGVGEASDGDDEDDDDFVIRTDRLAVNGEVGVGMGEGTGKGVVVGGPTIVDGGDGEGEDLYD